MLVRYFGQRGEVHIGHVGQSPRTMQVPRARPILAGGGDVLETSSVGVRQMQIPIDPPSVLKMNRILLAGSCMGEGVQNRTQENARIPIIEGGIDTSNTFA